MKHLTAALFALLAFAANAQSWTPEQRTLAAMYLAAHAVDYGQTRRIAAEPEHWREYNPILGAHPSTGAVNAYFALVPVAGYLLLDSVSSERRTFWLRVAASVEITNVGRNQYIGIRIKF